MKTITKDSKGIRIQLTIENEDMPYIGNCMASGDESVDKECEDWIRDQLNSGNDWAWCVAKVTVSYKDTLFATEYIGACSYENEKDFRNGGYFDDMVDMCIDDINNQLKILTED